MYLAAMPDYVFVKHSPSKGTCIIQVPSIFPTLMALCWGVVLSVTNLDIGCWFERSEVTQHLSKRGSKCVLIQSVRRIHSLPGLHIILPQYTYSSRIMWNSEVLSNTSCSLMILECSLDSLACLMMSISTRMSSLQDLPLLRFFSTLAANWLLVDFSVHFLTMANFPLLYVHGVCVRRKDNKNTLCPSLSSFKKIAL